eukprot:TRINITY_DN3663_c0_g1_i1.p1 TRINITY_DN3663_c0_g1~~TRINITY_DN3663_c0_g1_i1.p1  ORF type:complete len:773 (-),score=158.43 TRINITY_DN3663_c0_g1_i1:119-2437(-)
MADGEENKKLKVSTGEKTPLLYIPKEESRVCSLWHAFKVNVMSSVHARDVKIAILFLALFLGVVGFAAKTEPEVDNSFALSKYFPLLIPLVEVWPTNYVEVELWIPHVVSYFPSDVRSNFDIYLFLAIEKCEGESMGWCMDHNRVTNSSVWVPVLGQEDSVLIESAINSTELPFNSDVTQRFLFTTPGEPDNIFYRLNVSTNGEDPQSINLAIFQHGPYYRLKELYGTLVLVGMYILIIFEVIDRTVAALLGSFVALSVLAVMGERPSLELAVSWIEYDTLALLFGMMIIVGVFATTGFFEWIALKAYEAAKGDVWKLVLILSIFTAVSSGFLDNVTSILLLTPIILRLCKVGNIDPVPVLITVVLMSNVGGCSTAVGDPPMVIIVNNDIVIREGIDFAEVFFFMAPGTFFVGIVSMFYLKWYFKREFSVKTQLPTVREIQIRKEIDIWKETARRLDANIPEEREVLAQLHAYIQRIQADSGVTSTAFAVHKTENENLIVHSSPHLEEQEQPEREVELGISQHEKKPEVSPTGLDQATLEELREECKIRDRRLFIMCSIVLGFVIFLFFVENFISDWVHLPLSWIALVGALFIMVLADIKDINTLLHKVEWGTLIFFGALFVMMESVSKLGVVDIIGEEIAKVIASVDEDVRLVTAIIVLVWVSAIVSAIIDSIPFTTAMIPIVVNLSQDPKIGIGLRPLVYSLAFGTGLGGNGTLIGATANLVMAGLAEQYGFPVGFVKFAKVGFPLMLVSVATATVYLIIIFVGFGFGVK